MKPVINILTVNNISNITMNDLVIQVPLKIFYCLQCKENLKLLCDATFVFGDGTFNYAPKYFPQINTIHVKGGGGWCNNIFNLKHTLQEKSFYLEELK